MPTPNFAQLKSVLLTSGLQQKDNALYQVINQLLSYMSQFQRDVNSGAAGSSSSSGASANNTYLTETNEIANLPNSRRVLAGDYIAFDDAVANIRTISGSEWSVLTNGDPVSPELIFAGGDVIMTHIPQGVMLLEQVLLRGTRAGQPAANAVAPGTLYSVSDEGIIEQSDGTAWSLWSSVATFSRGITLSGTITTGFKGMIRIPINATIVGWSIMSDVSMDIEYDIMVDDPGVTFPPTTSIVAAAPPALVAQDFNDDTTLTGWTEDVNAGDVMAFSVTSVTGTPGFVALQVDLISRQQWQLSATFFFNHPTALMHYSVHGAHLFVTYQSQLEHGFRLVIQAR